MGFILYVVFALRLIVFTESWLLDRLGHQDAQGAQGALGWVSLRCRSQPNCDIVCPFGRLRDRNGCPLCDCFKPCQLVTCPQGQCIVQNVTCDQKQCVPQWRGVCNPSCPAHGHCDKFCRYGYIIDSQGCPQCECHDPCKFIKCTSKVLPRVCVVKADVLGSGTPGAVCTMTKTGVCPRHTIMGCQLGEFVRDQCTRDSDCQGPDKCCQGGCGRRCLPPVPAACPSYASSLHKYCGLSECNSDLDCPWGYTCCTNNCRTRLCYKPRAKIGKCPGRPHILRRCLDEEQDECQGDLDCGINNDLKCCQGSCIMQCMPPMKTSLTFKSHDTKAGETTCEPLDCRFRCQWGFQSDSNGCPVCLCSQDPCQPSPCLPGVTCEAVVHPCHAPPCAEPTIRAFCRTCELGQPETDPSGVEKSCGLAPGTAECSSGYRCYLGSDGAWSRCCPTYNPCQPRPRDCPYGHRCVAVSPLSFTCETCPTLNCPQKCEFGSEHDKDWCPLCDCLPDPCIKTKCPNGQFCKAQNVACVVQPCDNWQPQCMVCENPSCPTSCDYGVVYDSQGCPTCDCMPSPCQEHTCGPFQRCEVQTVRCKEEPCYPVALCVEVCEYGDPMLGAYGHPVCCGNCGPPRSNRPLQHCPDTYLCQASGATANPKLPFFCCPGPETPRQGFCPESLSAEEAVLCAEYQVCPLGLDSSCPADMKCCNVTQCGNVCLDPRYHDFYMSGVLMVTSRHWTDDLALNTTTQASHLATEICDQLEGVIVQGGFSKNLKDCRILFFRPGPLHILCGYELTVAQTSGSQDPGELLGQVATVLEEVLAEGEMDHAGPGTQPIRVDPSNFIVNIPKDSVDGKEVLPPIIPQCEPVMCQLKCKHGLDRDEQGCDVCACFDPCAGVRCRRYEVCVIREADCSFHDCFPRVYGECTYLPGLT